MGQFFYPIDFPKFLIHSIHAPLPLQLYLSANMNHSAAIPPVSSASARSSVFEQQVAHDLRQIRRAIDDSELDKTTLFRTSLVRSLGHLGFDWLCLCAALGAVMLWGWWAVPASLFAIGNRQRALGNVLHDLGHRNVSRRAKTNDFIAHTLVAPLLFADFEQYRKTHLAHHMHLGDPQLDPDYMESAGTNRNCWRETFYANVANPRLWCSTLAGDFAKPLATHKLRYIVLWWMGLLACIGLASGWTTAVVFLGLWLAARATVFFLITLVREMCDHFGRKSGGIFQFSRDITTRGILRYIVHPHNNGYHLTHHLLPTVPYYHLPITHRALLKLAVFQQQACICTSYLYGKQSVVQD
jgi:fatty acid desaturase